MEYKFAKNDSFAHLAAGGVIKSYVGHSNFPVRLGNEIFNRCLSYSPKKNDIKLYDPMCGSGYLITVLGLLNFSTISHISGSDINDSVLLVAKKNLNLLTQSGLINRTTEIEKAYNEHKRDAYREHLKHMSWYKDIVTSDKSFSVFQRDLFDLKSHQESADITIMDLPYDNLIQWSGQYDSTDIEKSIAQLANTNSIIAVIRDKKQKLDFQGQLRRLEKFQVGKRMVDILCPIT